MDPTSIKNGLKLGLDCLKKGMAILEVSRRNKRIKVSISKLIIKINFDTK